MYGAFLSVRVGVPSRRRDHVHVAHPDGAADGRTHRAHLALPHGRLRDSQSTHLRGVYIHPPGYIR